MAPIIVLDPGHGGKDPGASGNGLLEKNLALDIAKRVHNILNSQYIADVRFTRDSDVFWSLSERAAFANRTGADLFVSFHLNAGGGEGFESYIYPDLLSSRTANTQQTIHTEIMQFLNPYGVTNRGQKQANFAVLRETSMPAVLLETLFIDNQFDASLLKQPGFLQGLADATARGIARAMGLTRREVPPLNPEPRPTPTPHWALADHNELRLDGLLKNDHSKTLDAAASKGMAFALINRVRRELEGLPLEPVPSRTNDSNAHWALADHNELRLAGLLNNDHSDTFDEPVSKAIVFALVNRLRRMQLKLPPLQRNTSGQHWAMKDYMELRNAGLLNNDHSSTLDQPSSKAVLFSLTNRLRQQITE